MNKNTLDSTKQKMLPAQRKNLKPPARKRRKAQCADCGKTLNTYAVSDDWSLFCKDCYNPNDTLEGLKPAQQAFVNNIAAGQNQTTAYRNAYPNASYQTAMVNSSRQLRKAKIADAVQLRKNRNLDHSRTSPEEVLGSAVFQMRSSMDDVLDNDGSFSIDKARETGAVDLLKKHKETIRTRKDKDGTIETTKVIEVEILSNQNGRKEVADYIGLENFNPKPVPTNEELGFQLFHYLLHKLDITREEAAEYAAAEYPGVSVMKLLGE